MGVDNIVHVFIGRKCTDSEIEQCKAKLADMNDPDEEAILSPECASVFTSEDGYPIFAFLFAWRYQTDALSYVDYAEWFVVFRYIKSIHNNKSIPFRDLHHEKLDERFELFILHDQS